METCLGFAQLTNQWVIFAFIAFSDFDEMAYDSLSLNFKWHLISICCNSCLQLTKAGPCQNHQHLKYVDIYLTTNSARHPLKMPFSLELLPDIVVIKIFSFLPLGDRLRLERVSKRIGELSRLSWIQLKKLGGSFELSQNFHPNLYAKLIDRTEYRRSFGRPVGGQLRACCDDCVETDGDGDCSVSDVTWRRLLREVKLREGDLQHLRLTDACIGVLTLKVIVDCFGSRLRVLHLANSLLSANISSASTLMPIAEDCPALREFSVATYTNWDLAEAVQGFLPHLFKKCTKLKNLSLNKCYGIDSVDFASTRLEQVVLSRCGIEDDTIESLVSACGDSLQSLDLTQCSKLTVATLPKLSRCVHLRRLLLMQMQFQFDERIFSKSAPIFFLPNLRQIDLSYNDWLTKKVFSELERGWPDCKYVIAEFMDGIQWFRMKKRKVDLIINRPSKCHSNGRK